GLVLLLQRTISQDCCGRNNREKPSTSNIMGTHPSGNRMDGEDGKMMQKLRENGIHFERVAITDSQIEEYGLQHLKNTDPEVMAKLLRDPNAQHFRDEHDGELFQIELDALQALQPKTFKRLVLSNIDQHFDEDTYQELLNQHKPA